MLRHLKVLVEGPLSLKRYRLQLPRVCLRKIGDLKLGPMGCKEQIITNTYGR